MASRRHRRRRAEIPVIGRPWTLHLDIRGDGVPTIRHTTFVRHVVADPSS
jgi:hypothetical protein